MPKSRITTFSIVTLILINLLLVAFIVFRKPPHPKHLGPRNIIIEKLHFDENQINQYDALIEGHRAAITNAEDRILKNKNQLYSLLVETSNTSLKDSITKEIAAIYIEIEHIHYQHFSDIKAICTQEQMPYFNELIKEIAELFSHPKKHKKNK